MNSLFNFFTLRVIYMQPARHVSPVSHRSDFTVIEVDHVGQIHGRRLRSLKPICRLDCCCSIRAMTIFSVIFTVTAVIAALGLSITGNKDKAIAAGALFAAAVVCSVSNALCCKKSWYKLSGYDQGLPISCAVLIRRPPREIIYRL